MAVFGPDVLYSAGALDRRKLGTLVFADPARRRPGQTSSQDESVPFSL